MIKSLKKTVQESEVKVEVATSEKENGLNAEIKTLENELNDRDNEVLSLQIAKKAAEEVSEKLNRSLVENRSKWAEEKMQLLKEHRNEVKAWKKDLGEANSQIVRGEKRLTEENEKAINDFEKQLAVKDEELNVVSEEKQELEEKINSLLDVL